MKNLRAKNRLLVFTAVITMLFAAAFSACGSYTLEPVPEEKTYTVTFATDGGSTVEPQKVAAGKTVKKPADPTKDGAVFEGWYKDSSYSAQYDFSAAVKSDITIYAKWSGKAYKVTFNTNGGSAVEAISVKHGDTPSMPANPTKTGFDFKGWFKDAEFKEQFYLSPITSDLTLYAKWEVSVYTVFFNVDYGSAVSSQLIEHGGKVTKPADPTRANCIFSNWYTAPYTGTAADVPFDFTNTVITANTTIYAGWIIDGFTLTFVSNGGSSVPMQVLNKNGTEAATEPTAPTRTGYNFMGWYSDTTLETSFNFATPVSANTTVYAKWEIMKFEVSFYTSGAGDITPQIVEYGKSLGDPGYLDKDGYDFAGWYYDSEFTNPFNPNNKITSNITLYAKYQIQSYKITFNTMGGDYDFPPQTVTYGSYLSLDTPEKTGYDFVGWYTDSNCSQEFNNSPVTGPMTLYAGWTIKILQVTFVTFTNEVTVASQNVEYGDVVYEPDHAPYRDGFEFLGWYSDPGLSQSYTFGKYPVHDNISIYARWRSTADISVKATIQIINPDDVEIQYTEQYEYGYIHFELVNSTNLSGCWYMNGSTWGYSEGFDLQTHWDPGVYVIEWIGQRQDDKTQEIYNLSATVIVTLE